MAKRKTKTLFPKIETFLKRYQISISISISTLLSVIAIIVSLNANTLAKTEYEKNRLPAWDYKVINGESGNKRELQIISLKPEILLESFEIITPFNTTNKETIKSVKDILNLYEIENKILNYRNEMYTTVINHDDPIPEMVKLYDVYPIILKIKYRLENEIFYDYAFYKLNLKFFNDDLAKVISLSFIKKIKEYDVNLLAKFLDYNNKTECIERTHFSKSKELLSDIWKKDSSASSFIGWCSYFGQKSTKVLQLFESNHENPIEELEIVIPLLLEDSLACQTAISRRDSVVKTSKNYEILNASCIRIDSFLKANPFCYRKDYDCRKNSRWCTESAFNEWEELLETEKIQIWKKYNLDPISQ